MGPFLVGFEDELLKLAQMPPAPAFRQNSTTAPPGPGPKIAPSEGFGRGAVAPVQRQAMWSPPEPKREDYRPTRGPNVMDLAKPPTADAPAKKRGGASGGKYERPWETPTVGASRSLREWAHNEGMKPQAPAASRYNPTRVAPKEPPRLTAPVSSQTTVTRSRLGPGGLPVTGP